MQTTLKHRDNPEFRADRNSRSRVNALDALRPALSSLPNSSLSVRMLDDEGFLPPALARRDGPGAPEANLFAGGLKDYARHLAALPAEEEEDDRAGQRLAERFVRRPLDPVQVPERPLMSAIAPYLAAAGFFVFAGTGSAFFFFKGDAQEWTVRGTARAAIGGGAKIDTALTAFAPRTIHEPLEEHAAPSEEEGELEAPPAAKPADWAGAVETFKTLAAPKASLRQASAEGSNASGLLKAVEGWQKNSK